MAYFHFNIILVLSKNNHDVFSLFSVPLTFVQSVSGMLTNLPCNITPSVPGDKDCFALRGGDVDAQK